MTRYLLKQFALSVAIVLAMLTISFVAMKSSGDPRWLLPQESATQERWDVVAERMGLDRPVVVQYGMWVINSLTGDFGDSRRYGQSAADLAVSAIPETLKLLLGGLAAAALITSLSMAVYVKYWGPKIEYVRGVFEKIGPAVPFFLVGVLIYQVIGVKAGWIPLNFTHGGVERFVLASATLGIFMAFGMIRLLGPEVKSVVSAGAAGHSGGGISGAFWVRAVKSASIRLLASPPGYVLAVFTAVVVAEVMFNLRGLAGTAWEMWRYNEFAPVVGAVTCLTVAYATALFAAGIARAYLDRSVRQAASTQTQEYARPADAQKETRSAEAQASSSWQVFGRRPMIPLAILIVVALLAILGPCIAPHSLDPEMTQFAPAVPPAWLEGGDWNHPLGTDLYGRDLLSLIISGARYSLIVAAAVLALCASTSLIAVMAALYFGGFVDRALTWVVNFTSVFPIVLAGFVFSFFYFYFFFGLGVFWSEWILFGIFIGLLAMFVWRHFVQRFRTELLRSRSDPHINELKLNGVGSREMVSAYVRNLRPRLPKMILVLAAVNAGSVVLLESTFSFLGILFHFGFHFGGDVTTPWGLVTRQSMRILGPWWPALFAGIAIVLTVLSLNFLGTWLQERLEDRPGEREDGSAESRASVLETNGE